MEPFIPQKLNCNFHTPDKKTVSDTSRCSESNGVLCCSNSGVMTKTNVNGLETIYSLILQLSNLKCFGFDLCVRLLNAGVTVFCLVCVCK